MDTREKVIQLIESLSEEQLDAEYRHLLQAARPRVTDAEFEEALNRITALSERLDVSTDATRLIRNERDWLANRAP